MARKVNEGTLLAGIIVFVLVVACLIPKLLPPYNRIPVHEGEADLGRDRGAGEARGVGDGDRHRARPRKDLRRDAALGPRAAEPDRGGTAAAGGGPPGTPYQDNPPHRTDV